jgi:hypothetical protein
MEVCAEYDNDNFNVSHSVLELWKDKWMDIGQAFNEINIKMQRIVLPEQNNNTGWFTQYIPTRHRNKIGILMVVLHTGL